jgi:hypothetical protein
MATSKANLTAVDLARSESRERVTSVLEALKRQPQFATELAPDENRRPGQPRPVSEAVEQCINAEWAQMGHANSSDPRVHLTDAGYLELDRRRRQTASD